MPRVFITGSADGLGLLAAQKLIAGGHAVVLHGRDDRRAQQALAGAPGAETALAGDLSRPHEVVALAERVNALGRFDAVIHNAGVYQAPRETIFAVNVLAPYLLTCLTGDGGNSGNSENSGDGMEKGARPGRLVYLSSGLHRGGRARLEDLERRTGYGDSKFQIVLLAKAVARRWPAVFSNAVNPGWVPTKMGGPGAPDDLDEGAATQVWLAASDEVAAKVSGKYFFHRRPGPAAPETDDAALQDAWIARMEVISGVPFPKA